jgi:hypothetical protein
MVRVDRFVMLNWFGSSKAPSRAFGLVRVHQIAKLFARLEVRNTLRRDLYRRARLGVAARPRLALARAKAAKPAHLHLVIRLQRLNDRLKQRIDDYLAITASQVSKGYYMVDKVSFCHEISFAE